MDRGVSLLTALLPHLRNGLRIHRDMSHLRALQDAAAGALDRLACGCVLLDGEGGLLMANRSARAIFASADGLRLEGNGLQAVNAADNHRLRQLLSGRGGAGQPADCESEMLTISRASGRRPYVAILSRLPRRLTPLCRRQSSVLFLTDPEAAPDGQAAVICEMFGLSAAEVRVASLLMQGADTRQIAQRLRVSYNTARTHIQRILEKPGGRRQADFVRLVLSAMGCVRLR